MVETTVADTGPGIAPEIAAQLFQPFVTTKRQGMGVGLSISRTIIEAHGGELWVEPNAGGGSVFRFTLRAAAKEDLTMPDETSRSISSTTTTPMREFARLPASIPRGSSAATYDSAVPFLAALPVATRPASSPISACRK